MTVTDTLWSWVLPLGVSRKQAEADRLEFARIKKDRELLSAAAERLREMGH